VWEIETGLVSCQVASGSDGSYGEGLHFAAVILSALISSRINHPGTNFYKNIVTGWGQAEEFISYRHNLLHRVSLVHYFAYK
jgi:hypothetical protein